MVWDISVFLRYVGAALLEDVSGQDFEPAVDGPVEHAAAILRLIDEASGGEKPEVMGEGRGGHAGAFLDFAHRQALRPGPDQGAQNLQPGFRADGGETLGRFLDREICR